jgi:hypothetical protein
LLRCSPTAAETQTNLERRQPFGISCRDNVIKECGEEASVPPELAAQAVATGEYLSHSS